MSKLRTSYQDLQDVIRGRERFETNGAMRGAVNTSPYPYTGQLPQSWAQRLLDHNVSYIVWSYSTPIAWYDDERGWYVPDVKYSVTTSKHQNIVRASVPGYVEL